MKTKQDYEKEIMYYKELNDILWHRMVIYSINGKVKKYKKLRKMFTRNCKKVDSIVKILREKGWWNPWF